MVRRGDESSRIGCKNSCIIVVPADLIYIQDCLLWHVKVLPRACCQGRAQPHCERSFLFVLPHFFNILFRSAEQTTNVMASRKRKRSSKGTHSNQSGTSVKVIAPEDYNETIARAIRHLEAELASKIAWLPSGALTRTIRELSTSMNQIVQREYAALLIPHPTSR